MKYPESQQIADLIDKAKTIVIVQANNPDADSLGSSLALEEILGDLGKDVHLFCGTDMPTYLHYLPGWDRVQKELPNKFDLSIIVDTSAVSLLEQLQGETQHNWLATKPCIVIDHHDVESTIPYATVVCNKSVVATSEVIYELCQQLNWDINPTAADMITVSILSDSLGLVSEATSSRSIRIIAELVDQGVKLAALDNMRRQMMRKSPELVAYKGELLQRVKYYDNNRVATVTIPWKEIQRYSHSYNPSMLVIDDMRMTEGTDVAIAFKLYPNGKITAKIRCNYGRAIAGDLAKHFGGGGHPYASGFKIMSGKSFEEVQQECISLATTLLDKLDQDKS